MSAEPEQLQLLENGDPDPNSITYITPPTVGDFMQDDHFVRLIMGPVGSGKSAGCNR